MTILVITDAVKTIMMIIGFFVILRFFKTAFAAKQAEYSVKTFDEKKRRAEQAKADARKNVGKISVLDKKSKIDNVEDVDFEEVK
jgi:hypothetical protein